MRMGRSKRFTYSPDRNFYPGCVLCNIAMAKYSFLILALTLLCRDSFSQPKFSKDFLEFVPKGFATIAVAHGDLNEDGHDDIVFVCDTVSDTSIDIDWTDTENRPLIVLFWTPQGYTMLLRNDSAIDCKSCGGSYGDPFSGIDIKNGVLTISHHGGSAWQWEYIRKFKWIKDNLYLIGKSDLNYWDIKFCKKYNDYAATDFEDINLLNGKRHRKKISEDCKLLLDKWDMVDVGPLVPLSQFDREQ
jgi:hypothetical protein